MLIGKDDLGEVFDNIHNVWIQTRTTVIILCAADCDSICTTKILTVNNQYFSIIYLINYPIYINIYIYIHITVITCNRNDSIRIISSFII